MWDGTCDACLAGKESLCRNYRILGEHTQGAATSFVVVPSRNVHPRPERLSVVEAAAVPLVFQTAWRAIRTVAATQTGDQLAVIGAGGGASTAVVQVAKLLGARVVVASRNGSKESATRALGADDFVLFDDEHPLDRVLWQASGKRGFDVIFDSVGAPTVPRSVRALARGGRIVVIGATAGPIVEVDVRTLFWRQASIRGSTMANAAEFSEVLSHLTAGRLRAVVDSARPLEEAVAAFERLAAPDLFGKVVLTVP